MQSLTITNVEYSPTIGLGVGQLIIITGEFDLILDNNSSVTKAASGGEFRLQFPEYR